MLLGLLLPLADTDAEEERVDSGVSELLPDDVPDGEAVGVVLFDVLLVGAPVLEDVSVLAAVPVTAEGRGRWARRECDGKHTHT